MRAAINAYHAEHTLNVVPKVTMPAKAEGRQRWLTRNDAARLFGAAMGVCLGRRSRTLEAESAAP
jgi:hypothetical protein